MFRRVLQLSNFCRASAASTSLHFSTATAAATTAAAAAAAAATPTHPTVQLASNLHLELLTRRSPRDLFRMMIQPSASTLVLAGNVCSVGKTEASNLHTKSFLHECSNNFRHVVWVPGNCEHHGGTIQDTTRLMKGSWLAGKFPNIHVLDQSSIHLPVDNRDAHIEYLQNAGQRIISGVAPSLEHGVRFIGTTLWSQVTDPISCQELAEVSRKINDFGRIQYRGRMAGYARALQPHDVTRIHSASVQWLEDELDDCRERGKGAVVVTHHLPSLGLIAPQYQGSPLNVAFATDLNWLGHKHHDVILAWLFGHTHIPVTGTFADGKVQAFCNPHRFEHEDTVFTIPLDVPRFSQRDPYI
jgi:predicted phosphodiesterase